MQPFINRKHFLFPSKPLGCYGDAGALFTDNDEWAEKFRWLRVHRQTQAPPSHTWIKWSDGYSSGCYTIGYSGRFPEEVSRRIQIGGRYSEAFSAVDGLTCPSVPDHEYLRICPIYCSLGEKGANSKLFESCWHAFRLLLHTITDALTTCLL